MSLYQYQLKTTKNGLFNITDSVNEAVEESGVKGGIAVVYCPHTTGGITLNENTDPDVKSDFNLGMDKFVPDLPDFKHDEGNSAAHIKSSLVGASETLIIHEGHLLLGVWQAVYFAEFDAPRIRDFYVKIIAD